ncbi:hypothetical protein [Arsenophonus nasoniae]|uniref:hypothetical protein n=1 Tax=Arsenophonus nasoniae TaxID=638 RepID=UPI00387A80E0
MKSLFKVLIILVLPGFSSPSLAIDNDNDKYIPASKIDFFTDKINGKTRVCWNHPNKNAYCINETSEGLITVPYKDTH